MVALIQTPFALASQPRRVSNVLVDVLVEAGVQTFFGIPGGAISPIYDAFIGRDDVRVVNGRHETSAVFAAMGFERSGGGLPCILMTSGPGITNAITGIAAAHADGVPMICIAGEVPRKNFGRGALQEGSSYHLDVLAMVRSITKSAVQITSATSAAAVLKKAVITAMSGRRGPVFVTLPLDVANEMIVPTKTTSNVSTFFEFDESSLNEAAEALSNAQRPFMLVGSGCKSREASTVVASLAQNLRIPVATTPKAKGVFPESDPLSLGVFGYGGHPAVTKYLESGPDVVLCVGTGLGEPATNNWSPLLNAKTTFIHIDIDAAQIGKNYRADIGIVGPAHVVLQKLLGKARRRPRAMLRAVDAERVLRPLDQTQDVLPLKPARVMKLLQDNVPVDTIYTADIGEHLLFALHYLQVDEPDGFLTWTGLGSMGSGLCSAIGAKLAQPDRPVVAVCGDFGFQMFGGELATCVQDKIGVVFAVMNDARMRMVENGFSKVYGRTGKMDGPRIDFAAWARSMGAHGFEIKTAEQFQDIPASMLRGNRPIVLDIHIDPAASFVDGGRNAALTNFKGK